MSNAIRTSNQRTGRGRIGRMDDEEEEVVRLKRARDSAMDNDEEDEEDSFDGAVSDMAAV